MKIKAFFGMLVLGFSGFAWAQPTPIVQPIAGRLSSPIVNPRVITPEIINPGITLPGRLNPSASCPDAALEADVVAIDHPIVFNRLGAQNVNWMMYALRHDVIDLRSNKTFDYTEEGAKLFDDAKKNHESRHIALRPDLRPRPLVLRVAAGDYLKVRFTNLLQVKSGPHPQPGDPFSNQANPFDSYQNPLPNIDHPMEHAPKDVAGTPEEDKIFRSDDQVASRYAGFHPQGLELAISIEDDSSYVGKNQNSLAAPGETKTYCFYAPEEGTFLVSSDGAVFGGEGTAGNSGVGLFGAVTVQPSSERYKSGKDKSLKTRFYRAQVTEEELRLATKGTTPDGQPIIHYEATYPNDCSTNGVWCQEGKAGKPILNIVQGKRIIHGDINAIIIGPNKDGSFAKDTYPLESIGEQNPALPNRLEPFREFVSIFHDENAATQAFPYFFEHPELGHTLHGVRDSFMINYGSGGIGAEIIANRLQAGPMQDCLDCAYEEFFLSSFAVGDAAMLVDKPANLVISQCQPEYLDPARAQEINPFTGKTFEKMKQEACVQPKDQRATEAYYPHDPANVHHSYIGDFVKFRNLHSGKEQHIFHLHNHQWLFNPNDDNSNYIDAQGIGPGSGYTYEIAYGGSGNRNKTVGDAIFHCHYYPHFAQGMWYMWRIHDVFEVGTKLKVSEINPKTNVRIEKGFHENVFGLKHGKPARASRALPDGEIVSGTPIPAIVPLPGKGLAPVPEPVQVTAKSNGLGSKAELLTPFSDATKNPGFPFWVAGVTEHGKFQSSIGSRPTTPPLDMCNEENCKKTFKGFEEKVGSARGHDGGLPRHALAGYLAGGETEMPDTGLTRFSAEKHIKKAKPVYYPEEGTDLERLAMSFHAQPRPGHATHSVDMAGNVMPAFFTINGARPIPGAPFNEPCIDDSGELLSGDKTAWFFGGSTTGYSVDAGTIEFGADKPRVYKGANLQLDVVFNKLGYHYPQQRILTLWEDVGALLDKKNPKAPEPLVLRMNTFDCAMYAHTNLVPHYFYADDYQITTPTDVIGQHIHLPKWDLTSADGGANGWNYEDGTFSPGMVRERIHAINNWNKTNKLGEKVATLDGKLVLTPAIHPYFNAAKVPGHQVENCTKLWEQVDGDSHTFEVKYGMPGACDWFGARTTLQRWFSDPLVNRQGIHRGLGITFTHDHLGPSTHQQLGLYATMLTEPPGSEWRHNETGTKFYTRDDGGPTSWQAVITGKDGKSIDVDHDKRDDSYREFFLQFGDFQHAYVKDAFYGVTKEGYGWMWDPAQTAKPTAASFRDAINPSIRKPSQPVFPDIIAFEPTCPGGKGSDELPGAVYNARTNFNDPALYNSQKKPLRPCPEGISADDVGMMVVNYRNEPVGARVYDPDRMAPDGKKGMQASGIAGDLAFAMATINSRKLIALNTTKGNTPYQELTHGMFAGDPFTPIMRAYSGDLVKVKVQGGAHEHEHNGSINAMAWIQGGSGFGQAPHSGWRNAQNTGLSEQFTFTARITDHQTNTYLNDRMYTIDTSQDGLWNGVWGILRSKNTLDRKNDHLVTLPSNPIPTVLGSSICPSDAKVRNYEVAAVLANKALGNTVGASIPDKLNPAAKPGSSRLDPKGGTLVYNPRATSISIEMEDENGKVTKEVFGTGPLHDPTAILFVRKQDLDANGKIKPERPVEPLVLRAAAGECIQVTLENRLPRGRSNMPDLDGYTSVSGIIHREKNNANGSLTTFNNNLLRPSNHIGLHPQLVHYDVQAADGNNVGINHISTIAPGETIVYQWYAGYLETTASAQSCPDYRGNIMDKYRDLSLLANLSKLKGGLPTRLPAKLMTETAFQETVIATLDPEYLETGVVTKEVQVIANRLVAAAKRRQLLVSDNAQADKAAVESRLGNVNTDALFNSVSVNGLSSNIEKVQRFSDQVPLLDRNAYIDWNKSFDAFGDIQGTVKLLQEDFTRILRGVDEVLKNSDMLSAHVADLTNRQRLGTLKTPILNKIGANLAIDPGKLNPADPQVITQVSNSLAEKLANSLFFEAFPHDAGIFDWRTEFFNRFDPKLSHDNIRVAEVSEACRFVPVEFGGTNLSPPDRIKQGQKAAIGALVIEPEKSFWIETAEDDAIDRQNPGVNQINKRKTRATATVFYPTSENYRFFRDLVLVHQKGLNFRYKDGSAVANLAAEKEKANERANQTAPEDAHDSGHMAINYGAEPMWFRFGLPPDAPFGKEGLGGAASAWQAFSNDCCENKSPTTGGTVISANKPAGEPYVPVMTAYAGQEMRVRSLMPTGVGRASTMELHGHAWARDPYLAENVVRTTIGSFPAGGNPATWGIPSRCIGENAMAMHLGGQESVSPMSHFDLVFPRAGGTRAIKGDFLWRDHTGFGITNGLWSIIRVEAISSRFTLPTAPVTLRFDCKAG